jgi:hypothetical protein
LALAPTFILLLLLKIPNGSVDAAVHHPEVYPNVLELKRKLVMRGYNNQLAGGPITGLIRMA